MLSPPLASLLWTIPVVVLIEIGAVFMGLGAVVPRVSFIGTDFARKVRSQGINGTMNLLFAPFLHFLDEEV